MIGMRSVKPYISCTIRRPAFVSRQRLLGGKCLTLLLPEYQFNMGAYAMGNTGLVTTDTIVKILFTFAGIALYNTTELIVLIFVSFKRYGGLYFWSLLLATSGIIPYTLGLLFKFFGVIKIDMLSIALVDIGWQLMVTGQSIVLYSRLHLVLKNRQILRYV